MLTGVGVAVVDAGGAVVSVVEFADRVMVPLPRDVESDSVSFDAVDALCSCPDTIVVVVIDRYVPVILTMSRGSSVTGRVVMGPVIVVSDVSSGAASAAASSNAGAAQRARISAAGRGG